ncbi:MAG: alpha/beta fold hydrolase [Verrucomicrobiota bacterium]|nr:alpha/beta fold hydrolase [Verrucomicrobiota bacterium]
MTCSRSTKLPADIREEYPFTGNLMDLPSGVKMHYLDEGSGPVLLMLHGNPTWSFYYRGLVNKMVYAGYRCIVPDHIGCGLSDKPPTYNYKLEQRIEDVASLLHYLEIESYSLIVHDWGGAIGCGLAVRRPKAVEKIVLLNTAAFNSRRIPWRIAALKVPWLGEFIIRALNGFAGPAVNMSVRIPLSPAVKRGFLWPYRSWANRIATWSFVKDIPLHKKHVSFATLATIEASLPDLSHKPIHIVWGGKDFCFNHYFLKRWQTIFPTAELSLFPLCGHYILEDGRAEAETVIQRFIDKV